MEFHLSLIRSVIILVISLVLDSTLSPIAITNQNCSQFVTKNRCVTHVKIRGYANLVSSLLAYLISAVASWFSNSILSRSRMMLQIVCCCNITLFGTAGKF